MSRVTLTLLLIVTSFVTGSAHAQDFFEKRRDGVVKGQINTLGPKTFKSNVMDPPTQRNWTGNQNLAYCKDGSTDCDPSYEEETIEGGARDLNMNYYGSMMGFQAGMNSKFHTDATIKRYLKGDLTLAYITMGLTEPAVAAGLAQAVNYVGADVNNRLQGEQLFFSQLNYMPDISDALGQAHISCISHYTREGYNWMYAQAACTGDTAGKEEDGDSAKFNFNEPGDPSDETLTSFQFDPNYDKDSDAPLKIKLSDYLFQRDVSMDASPGIENLKESFVALIGDITYEFDPYSKTALGTRRLTYTKEKASSEEFEALFRDSAKKIHTVILEAMAEFCKNESPEDAKAIDGEGFLKRHPEWAPLTSFPGFSNDITLMNQLYEIGPDKSNGNCPDYAGKYGWDAMLGNPDAPVAGRDYLFVAHRIAFARIYAIYIIAEQYIRKLSVGAFDNFARKAAFELLYEVAGSTDLHAVYDQNVKQLRDYIEKRSKYTSAEQATEESNSVAAVPGPRNDQPGSLS